jgi:hypothetical protein
MYLSAALWCSAKVSSGTGTVRVRVGGDEATVDGIIVATGTVTATAFAAKVVNGFFMNASGQEWIKVTAAASGASETISVRRPIVSLQG